MPHLNQKLKNIEKSRFEKTDYDFSFFFHTNVFVKLKSEYTLSLLKHLFKTRLYHYITKLINKKKTKLLAKNGNATKKAYKE